nr:hypothetical protein [Tanacetum cinerariifolium]
MNQLEKKLDKEEFQEIGSMAAFKVLGIQFQTFIKSWIYLGDEYVIMTRKKSIDKRALHKRDYDNRETSSRSGNDAHVDDTEIRPIYDEEPMVEVQLIAEFTTYYLPREREFVVVKPHHVIVSGKSSNSSKNMPRFSSNDMVHNHYLYEARKKTQEKGRNSKPSVMPYARAQTIANELAIQDHNDEQSSSKLVPNIVPPTNKTATSQQELELLFSPMYEEYFNTRNPRVSKSSALSNNSTQHDTQPTLNDPPIFEPINPPTNVNAKENM